MELLFKQNTNYMNTNIQGAFQVYISVPLNS